ncbi:MAG: hypothetical protein MUC43_16040 [Pirellula sp.]|jgi:hypothetical protein|nr:hypothetical protein [Pirellula sp.]
MESYYWAILVATIALSPIYGQDVIRTKDLGKVVELHGVSGKPIGTVWSGVLRRVETIDGKTVVTISLENTTGKNEFVFFRDEKFNDFIRIEGTNAGINSSLERMVGEKIFGWETYVSIGVPREFIASINEAHFRPFFRTADSSFDILG